MTVEFAVHGTPKPQGSHKAFVAGGRAMMKPAGGHPEAQWRNAVAQAAHELVAEHGCLDGPLRLDVLFRFPMPKSRPKAARERGWAWKTTAPDVDKLVRAVADALTASGLIRDDSLIVDLCATKIETLGWTGATITLEHVLDPSTTMSGPRTCDQQAGVREANLCERSTHERG